jgi:hypothetical protein
MIYTRRDHIYIIRSIYSLPSRYGINQQNEFRLDSHRELEATRQNPRRALLVQQTYKIDRSSQKNQLRVLALTSDQAEIQAEQWALLVSVMSDKLALRYGSLNAYALIQMRPATKDHISTSTLLSFEQSSLLKYAQPQKITSVHPRFSVLSRVLCSSISIRALMHCKMWHMGEATCTRPPWIANQQAPSKDRHCLLCLGCVLPDMYSIQNVAQSNMD